MACGHDSFEPSVPCQQVELLLHAAVGKKKLAPWEDIVQAGLSLAQVVHAEDHLGPAERVHSLVLERNTKQWEGSAWGAGSAGSDAF